jgi:hypothetical protein
VILKGTAATVKAFVYVDGTLTALSNNGTVTVRDALGNTVATGNGTTGGTGIVTFPLTPSHTAELNRLAITWSGLVVGAGDPFSLETSEEVVGELLFTEAEARAYDGAVLNSSSSYPDATIQTARDRIAEAFGVVLGFNVGRRYGIEVVDGSGLAELWLPEAYHLQALRSVATRVGSTWTAFSADQLADVIAYPNGRLVRESLGTWPVGMRNVRVVYEAGNAIPLELKQAALRVLRDQLVGSNIPDRALRHTDEIGTFDLVVAGGSFGKWFGIPMVDATLLRYREKVSAAY